MFWKKIFYYINPLTLFGERKERTDNTNLKMMHGINRLSILMFLACIVIMLIKFWPF